MTRLLLIIAVATMWIVIGLSYIKTPAQIQPINNQKELIAENLELVTFKKDGYLCFVIQRNDFYGGVAVSCLSEKGEN
jgi:hypothetical protein